MTPIRKVVVCAFGVVLASACSTGGPSGSPASAPAGGGSSAATAAQYGGAATTVATAQGPLGQILTDGHGRAVYLFEADTATTSTCTGGCANEWPPLTTTGAPVAGAQVSAALLATSPRGDGSMQVAYNGHPLYYFAKDTGPGTTAGQGINSFGADWYLVNPAGTKIDTD